MIKTFFASLLFLFGSVAARAEMIAECRGTSPRFPGFHIQLYQDANAKLGSSYTLGKLPLYVSPWTNAGSVTTPPVRFPDLLAQANQAQDTGIDASEVKLFQMIFIDGSGTWDVELWKLMKADGSVVGWMAYAYGEPVGCAKPAPALSPLATEPPPEEPACEDLTGIYAYPQPWPNAPISTILVQQHGCDVIQRTFLLTDPDRRHVVTHSYHDHLDMKIHPDPEKRELSRQSFIDNAIVITFITQAGRPTIEEHWQVINDVLYVTKGHRNFSDEYLIDEELKYPRFTKDSPLH